MRCEVKEERTSDLWWRSTEIAFNLIITSNREEHQFAERFNRINRGSSSAFKKSWHQIKRNQQSYLIQSLLGRQADIKAEQNLLTKFVVCETRLSFFINILELTARLQLLFRETLRSKSSVFRKEKHQCTDFVATHQRTCNFVRTQQAFRLSLLNTVTHDRWGTCLKITKMKLWAIHTTLTKKQPSWIWPTSCFVGKIIKNCTIRKSGLAFYFSLTKAIVS